MSEKDKLVEQYVEQYKDLCEALGIIKPIDRIKVCVALAKIAELAKAEATKWHYPSKGEFPEINEIVFLYLKGRVYKPGCFMCVSEKNYEWCIDCDRNKEVDRSEVLAWQYIVPPKEEA